MQTRSYANPFDRPIKGAAAAHGVDPSPDAIGGHFGVGWYEHFCDSETGEVYRVHCTDGVHGGKGSFSERDTAWVEECYHAIIARTHAEAESGVEEVRISSHEWNIMLGRIRQYWLDDEEEFGGRGSHRPCDEGLIGHIHGVPVVVDPSKEDDLPM